MMRAAVLGHPISHSLSPVLHRAAYRALGLDWRYDAVDVPADRLPAFLAALDDTWVGLSLTMPLKQSVLPELDDASPLVHRLGAANTVVLRAGRRHGDNTDVSGIVTAIRSAAPDRQFPTVGIVGAGATAGAAMVAAEQLGAREVLITARRHEASRALAGDPRLAGGATATAVAWQERSEVLAAPGVVVTLPGDAAATLSDLLPEQPGVLLDVTYFPWPTTLAAAWQRHGGTVVPGHRMLLWQAVRQVELMTGREAPAAAMAQALDAALSASPGL